MAESDRSEVATMRSGFRPATVATLGSPRVPMSLTSLASGAEVSYAV